MQQISQNFITAHAHLCSLKSMMAVVHSGPPRNQKLENVRHEALSTHAPPNIEDQVEELIEKTRRVHVGFLFCHKYDRCETWRALMLNLCATSSTNIQADWRAFSSVLGIDTLLIQSIENVNPGSQDPVTNTLLALAQRQDATLSKVVNTLREIKRWDILNQILPCLSELAEGVLREHGDAANMNNMVDSGYLSQQSGEQEESNTIIQPKHIPTVPCLLKNKEQLGNAFQQMDNSFMHNLPISSPCSQTSLTPSQDPPREHEIHVQSPPLPPSSPSQPPSCVVMLTFAADGQEAAEELARTLRHSRNVEGRCGVLILQEQLSELNKDPINFIGGCFKAVDYIVPVLTPGYLRSIGADATPQYSTDCADANYARYIYRMMLDEFTLANCMNERVRSVIPDCHLRPVAKHIATMPIFQAYYKSSAQESFARKIVCRKI